MMIMVTFRIHPVEIPKKYFIILFRDKLSSSSCGLLEF